MKSRITLLVLALALAACGQSPQDREATADAVATPFYLLGKGPACVGTIVIAGPLLGAAALANGHLTRNELDTRPELVDGITDNCGPPYTVQPPPPPPPDVTAP